MAEKQTKQTTKKEYVVQSLYYLEKLDEKTIRTTPSGTYVDLFIDDVLHSFCKAGVKDNKIVWRLVRKESVSDIETITL